MARLAVTQMTATNDVEKNWQVCRKLVRRAADRGAELVTLPECFAFIGENFDETLAFMRPLDDELIQRYRKLARDTCIWISLGGFQQHAGDKAANSHIVIDDDGDIRAVYRKIHLFDVDIPGGPKLTESQVTEGGDELVVVDSPVGKLGLCVCYDLRFAEQYVALRKMGAEVILNPAAFTATTGKAHWEVLLRARAIETQCYVAAAAQWGRHNQKRNSHGEAMIVDPWGSVVGRCGEGTGLSVVELDPEYLRDVRQRMPVMEHRRPRVYGEIVGGE
jgi:predicted amidohydrolase